MTFSPVFTSDIDQGLNLYELVDEPFLEMVSFANSARGAVEGDSVASHVNGWNHVTRSVDGLHEGEIRLNVINVYTCD